MGEKKVVHTVTQRSVTTDAGLYNEEYGLHSSRKDSSLTLISHIGTHRSTSTLL
jgi:hypothetical protein